MPETCPVTDQAQLVTASSLSLAAAIRKLRRLAQRCETCTVQPCATAQYWNDRVRQALSDLTTEWQLT